MKIAPINKKAEDYLLNNEPSINATQELSRFDKVSLKVGLLYKDSPTNPFAKYLMFFVDKKMVFQEMVMINQNKKCNIYWTHKSC